VGGASTLAEAYAWFTPPLAPGVPQGLWFDLALVGGAPADATLSIFNVDVGCERLDVVGVYGLSEVLAEPRVWKTTCTNLVPSTQVDALGFTFSGSDLDVGMSQLRFGPPCPAL
jgi:hypothetical protein